ncbi:MAG: class I adenylate-forming enzyme family protein [Pseudomonadota bacterium]|nr:class I adenylate-forming enzyme family protein [Pseudomonadota bacterium]
MADCDKLYNLGDFLAHYAKQIPNKTAIIFNDQNLSYAEINRAANQLAHVLLALDVKKGDHIFLFSYRSPELIIAFLAALKIGAVAVPGNYELPPQQLRQLILSLQAKLLLCSEKLQPVIAALQNKNLNCPTLLLKELGSQAWLKDGELTTGISSLNPKVTSTPDDIAYLNYTSGSTGKPKGAITTHANIIANTKSAINALELGRDDIHLCMFAPFAHPHELLARPLYLGGTMVLLDHIRPKSIARALTKHQVTAFMGLAPLFETLLEINRSRTFNLDALKLPESGGMYTNSGLIRRFLKTFGVPIVPVWGSTETTGIAIANRPGKEPVNGSVGQPCPGYKVEIIDQQNHPVKIGETGELIFQGEGVVAGYYESQKKPNRAFHNEWYYSGDLARQDEKGNIYFIARRAGMLKVAGLAVFPQEIEMVLQEHPDILEVAVIGTQDRLRGEIPVVHMVLRPGTKLKKENLLAWCREDLASYKLPRKIVYQNELPKTSNGKIDRQALMAE